MKVFLDSNPTLPDHAARGMGRYAHELKEALKKDKDVKLVDQKDTADIIHYPYFDLFFLTLPKRGSTPVVVTVHDTHPLIYPEDFPAGIRGNIKLKIQKKRLGLADAVITNTETTKKDVVRFLDISPDKIFVTHFAPNKKYTKLKIAVGARVNFKLKIQKRYDLPEHFMLYVGDINYNKNIPGLLHAFSLVIHRSPTTNLVLVGKAFQGSSTEAKNILQLIEQLHLDERVNILGFVPDDDLVKIYNLAQVYCQPSFYEGFGFPVLEALACGCPVVAGKTQALVEIAEGMATFADPKKPESLAEALNLVLSGKNPVPVVENINKKFSWEKTAQQTVEVYREVLNAR